LQRPNTIVIHAFSNAVFAPHSRSPKDEEFKGVLASNARLREEKERADVDMEVSKFNMWAGSIAVAVLLSFISFLMFLAGALSFEPDFQIGFAAFGIFMATLSIPTTYAGKMCVRGAWAWKGAADYAPGRSIRGNSIPCTF
jgi:tellurite resistance protein TehA-like permease